MLHYINWIVLIFCCQIWQSRKCDEGICRVCWLFLEDLCCRNPAGMNSICSVNQIAFKKHIIVVPCYSDVPWLLILFLPAGLVKSDRAAQTETVRESSRPAAGSELHDSGRLTLTHMETDETTHAGGRHSITWLHINDDFHTA